MQTHWEKLGVLGPIYSLLGRGLSDDAIAAQLHLDHVKVGSCVSWLLRFLRYDNREQLVLRASPGLQAERCGLRP